MKFPSYAILCTGLLLLLPMGAFAVSLGDEMILSRLGDPVEIEIDVLQWEDMDLERVQISAASREEYEVFKLTWLPVLEHLNFNLVGPDLDGKVRVLISSRDPLDEPFLELLLVLRWPGGSLRREYVLLFDPPGAPLAVAQPESATPAVSPADTPAPAPALVMNVPELPAGDAASEPVVPAGDAASEPAAPAGQDTVPVADANAVPQDETRAPDPTPQLVALVAPQPVEPAATSSPVAPARTVAPPVAAPDLPPPVVEAEPKAAAVIPPAVDEASDVTPPAPEPVADTATSVQSAHDAEPPVTANATPEAAVNVPPAAVPDEVEPAATVLPSVDSSPDARTQVAIEVDTLAPQPAATAVDTTRRTYQVRAGDSLWNIARQFRPAGAGENLYQMLLGIHDLNRNSFINGNISLLKANALLQMPNERDIAAIDAAGAQAEFDRRWEAGTQRFDAAQRGEAIPLFANELPEEEPAAPIEPELPPGTEAPPPSVDDGGLIMVSAANAAQPLQLALADDAAVDVAAEDAGFTSTQDPAATGALETATDAADAEPASPPQLDTTGADASDGLDGELARDIGAADNAAVASPDAGSQASTVAQQPATVSVVVATAELETELAAMRTRRETAEALARQLQESLQRAQAERAARTALLGPQNLPLAGGALALMLALVAGVVFMLKLAGELRAARIEADVARVLPRGAELPSGRAHIESKRNAPARTEPTLTEQPMDAAPTSMPLDAPDAARIEVVEIEAPGTANATAPASSGADDPDDLFARMDGILGTAQKSPQK